MDLVLLIISCHTCSRKLMKIFATVIFILFSFTLISNAEPSAEKIRFDKDIFGNFKKEADNGDVDSMWTVGNAYLYGNYSHLEQNISEGIKWHLKAANMGGFLSQYTLFEVYASGEYVPQDLVEAAKWLSKVGEQMQPLGQLSIGIRFFEDSHILISELLTF